MSAAPAPALRPYLPSDAPVLAGLFQASIEELAAEDYDEAQCAAWASKADDEAAFGQGLQQNLTLIATVDGAPAGFISLKGKEDLDMLYVHPDFARQGVAGVLLSAIEKLAAARGAKKLDVEASDTAKPFFDKHGFVADHRNTVEIEGEWLGRTHMHKNLGETREEKR
ncbi:GNAT family N-acetyltransferase [Beijerinckia indica]|uniref:GCN5-related N-acetyltransferase n=1 Tax=Beijerinckia indica subsp. indica (strain ATCC 9039 / DSM 1715 / NCIMB 8712) TaxID=395963 RepID=B2IEE0_BEII9|nr:GNAT family N-acetyltransferase [Beijerinckia indica]ACB95538.1 GCN5-related N-acetyltransferase [Beijerinckia indica subsp. indica ATCC 9039]